MSSKLFDLTGKVAIVTGAGRGIGKSIAIGLAQHGVDIVLCSRSQKELETSRSRDPEIRAKSPPYVC